jgi:hypothetical protein
MSRRDRAVFAALTAVALLGAGASPVRAQFAIGRSVVAGGGGASAGGAFALIGSAGQPAVGTAAGGSFVLAAGFWLGSAPVVAVGDEEATEGGAPLAFALHPAAPNPFGRATTLDFDLPREGYARLVVYDAAGRAVATLADGLMPAGRHHRVWSGSDGNERRLSAGVYFARLETSDRVARRKVILLP